MKSNLKPFVRQWFCFPFLSILSYPSRLITGAPVRGEHEKTVIMLHGLGDTGDGWSFCRDHMQMENVKWLFPTAPTRPISCNMGMAMPGWFDLRLLPLSASMDEQDDNKASKEALDKFTNEEDINDSVRYCLSLVDKEIEQGVPPNKIVLGGFSQGGLIAARAALLCKHRLAACVLLSSWIGNFGEDASKLQDLPFFIGHGDVDPMVPLELGKKSYAYIKELGNEVTMKTYRGVAHSCNMEELDDLKDFLIESLEDQVTMEDLEGMSAGKLKKWLLSKRVDIAGCLEKSDLLSAAKEYLSKK